MADMMDAAREALAATSSPAPDVASRNAVIEECAAFIEQHQERITETGNGSERSVWPRMTGNQMGLAYAAALRALADVAQTPSGDGK